MLIHCRRLCSHRINPVGIQLLPDQIASKLFGSKFTIPDKFSDESKNYLRSHDIHFDVGSSQQLSYANISLPSLVGSDIGEHVLRCARSQISNTLESIESLAGLSKIPSPPSEWVIQSGWIKYDFSTGSTTKVEWPNEKCLTFDVEVLSNDMLRPLPCIAIAVSPSAWYCWLSEFVVESLERPYHSSIDQLIPLPSSELIVGHNVSYDRSFIKDQYSIDLSGTKFLDTMAMHIAICGMTTFQQQVHRSRDGGTEAVRARNKHAMGKWMESSSMNNLLDVHNLHCPNSVLTLDKSQRSIFVTGNLEDIRSNIQQLCSYCASDVLVTTEVLMSLWPRFKRRFPHPATLAGMLEMSRCYLPVNANWNRYIRRTEDLFTQNESMVKSVLMKLAVKACELQQNDRWKTDAFLKDLDWVRKRIVADKNGKLVRRCAERPVKEGVTSSVKTYPGWFLDLCELNQTNQDIENVQPTGITLGQVVAVQLMRLTWNGSRLHKDTKRGWGYLMEKNAAEPNKSSRKSGVALDDLRDPSDRHEFSVARPIAKADPPSGSKPTPKEPPLFVDGHLFVKLPHVKDVKANVGNPLGKDFLAFFVDGTLQSEVPDVRSLIDWRVSSASWRSNRDRVRQQLVYGHDKDNFAAILPRVITAGTSTRRGVEPTWLVATNPSAERLGSEMKAIVQTPSDYRFVGADVDSQELWLAALMADASIGNCHGATPFSWMSLQGSKASGNDLHSRTAAQMGITRDQAKVLNYARIYGAGTSLVTSLLHDWKPELTSEEVDSRVAELFKSTKGKMKFIRGQRSWQGGTESSLFDALERRSSVPEPRTPALNAAISYVLQPPLCGDKFYLSRLNWLVQSSGVDFLHILLVLMRSLVGEGPDALFNLRLAVAIHDEIRFMCPARDVQTATLALQIAHLLTRSFMAFQLGFSNIPQSVAYFESVEVDTCLRKDPFSDCVTPSNPEGLKKEYGIPLGQSITLPQLLASPNIPEIKQNIQWFYQK